MTRFAAFAILTAAVLPRGADALTLELPAYAVPLAERGAALDSRFVATSGYNDGALDGVTAEGAVSQQSWRVGAGALTTLQMLAPLRAQLEAAGFDILFECEARACGGFDFRYRLDVLPEPDMHVNLGDFRYLSAKRPGDPADYATLFVSRSANAGFVQLTRIGTLDETEAVAATGPPAPAGPLAPVGAQLESKGYATLDGLTFDTGSAALGSDGFTSLAALADYLNARPAARVTLVGHTDTAGALEGNIALSRRRAESVADRLVDRHGVSPDQVAADGVGYLAPRASNMTDEGRTRNRRVEVILTSTK